MNKTAVIYVRVSTSHQAKEELPIQSQLDACEKKAAAMGLDVVKVFADEGLSASNDNRPAFQDAIRYCENFDIGHLVTWSSSRFARNKVDAGFYKNRLEQAGTNLVYVTMDIDTKTTSGWLIDGVMEIFDELYSRQVSADTTRSMIKNAQAGFWNGGRPCFGFRSVPSPSDPKRRILEVIPEEADVLDRIFSMKLTGLGARAICRSLNEQKVENRGKPWRLTTMRELLRNESLVGKRIFGKTTRGKGARRLPRSEWIIVDSHEPAVDPVKFYQVQELLDAETNPVKDAFVTHHLLTGLLTCQECGKPMHIESATGRSRTYHYYHCRAAKLTKSHQVIRHRAEQVDQLAIDVLFRDVFTTEALADMVEEIKDRSSNWHNDKIEQIQRLRKEIDAITAKNSNLITIIENAGLSPDAMEITDRIRENKREKDAKQAQLKSLEKRVGSGSVELLTVEMVEKVLAEIFQESDSMEEVRLFMRGFIDRIEISQSEISIQYEPSAILSGAVRQSDVWLPCPGSNQGPND